MKRILLLSLLCLTLVSCVSIPEGYKKVSDDSDIYVNQDEFRGINFYYHEQFFNNRDEKNPIKFYIGENNDNYYLRLVLRYYGSQWIFFENAYLMNAAGEKWQIKNINTFEKNQTITNSGSVIEKYDASLSDADALIITAIMGGEDVKLRLSGSQYHYDYKISDECKNAIISTMKYYISLKYPEKLNDK